MASAGLAGEGVIPGVDLAAARAAGPRSDARRAAAAELCDACARVGFVTVTGHGVDSELVAGTLRAAEVFFALPLAEKRAVSPRAWNPGSPNVYRGYFPSSVHGKEGLDLGDPRITPAMRALVARPFAEPNRLPAVLGAAWHETVERYFAALAELAETLLGLLAESLDGDAAQLAPAFRRPEAVSTLRLNFYPGRGEPVARTRDGIGLAAGTHTDSGVLTVLYQDRQGGLQVRARGGGWLDVPFDPGAFVVNTGLALERLTAGALPATPQRVLHAAGRRISIPFFFEPAHDTPVALPTLGLPAPDAAAGDPGPTYEEHLREAMARFLEYQREL